MRIEITEKGSKAYYEETLFMMNSLEKLINNPNMKVGKLSNLVAIYGVIAIPIFIVFLLLYIRESTNVLFLIVTILFAVIIVLDVLYVALIKSKVNKLVNESGNSSIEINSESVKIETKGKKYGLYFSDIKSVIFNKNSICFLSKDINKMSIFTRIDYKDEIINELKTLNKESLIINKQ